MIVKNELVIIDMISAILVTLILFTEERILRIILGLPFILFFPGYVLIAALFVRKKDLSSIERVALSFGLSIAIVPLIGLMLNYTPWGIRTTPVLISLFLFILLLSCVAIFRRSRVPEEERFCLSLQMISTAKEKNSLLDRAFSIILIISILLAIGTLIYVIATPKVGERFTEFYLLGPGGMAEGYPRELAPGEEGKVIIGVVNREYEEVTYTITVRAIQETGESNKEKSLSILGPFTLKHEEKWEKPFVFSLSGKGENIKIEFLLFREDKEEPYLSLHLWVTVS